MTPEPPEEDARDAGAAPGRTRLEPDSWHDPVTGLPGPAFWRTVVATESARNARYRRPASVVLAEIVGLAAMVDLWGDDVAAQALVAVGRVLQGGCRSSDYVARLDDARFGVLLTETDEVAAINYVERVRERCERRLRTAEQGVRVAFGWASPTGSGTLLVAAGRAETRLRRERGD